MRTVLLRIIFDVWACEAVGNEFHLGFGWVIAVWCLAAAAVMGLIWKKTGDKTEVLSSLLFWAAVPAVLITMRVLNLPFVQTGIPVFGYGFMMFVGFGTATLLAAKRAPTVGLSKDIIWDLMMWLLVPGLVGARMIYISQNWDRMAAGRSGFQMLQSFVALWDGGLVFYGGVFGGAVGLFVYAYRRKVHPLLLADIVIPSLFIGSGFGRIGCFLFGCCFGGACAPDMPLAVHFPEDSNTFPRLAMRSLQTGEPLIYVDGEPVSLQREGEVLPKTEQGLALLRAQRLSELRTTHPDAKFTTTSLHPAQLYSSGLAFALAGFLMWLFPKRKFNGFIVGVGLMMYAINRFTLEVVRNDEPGRLDTGFTFSQLVSFAMIAIGATLLIVQWMKIRKTNVTQSAS